jgi:hypothetical protein
VVTTESRAWHTHGLGLPVSNLPLTSELGGDAVELIVQVMLAEPTHQFGMPFSCS